MKINISVVRLLKNNKIHEYWNIENKSKKLINDPQRKIYYSVRKTICENTLENYLITSIEYDDHKIIKSIEYEYNAITINSRPISEIFTIIYKPALSKKCKYCKFNIRQWCTMKNKQITKDSHYRCFYWIEKSLMNESGRVNGNISKRKTPKRNGM